MHNKLKLETYILNFSNDNEDYYTNAKLEYLSLSDNNAHVAAKKRLDENNNDYLAGYVYLSYDTKDIFTQEMFSEDLLYTWGDLIRLLTFPSEKVYNITFLDNALGDAIITEKDENYTIEFEFANINGKKITIPKQELLTEIEKKYKDFINFCNNDILHFSDESLFKTSLKEYENLVKK